jgi:Xaa-Pro aminopeptidase
MMKNYILQNENAIYYECGYSCDNVIYIQLGSESFFITDGRYAIDAKENIKNNVELIITGELTKVARKILKKNKIKKIYFDPNDFSVLGYENLTKKLDTKFIQAPNFSKEKRMIKSNDEIVLLKRAMKLGRRGFKKFQKYLLNDGVNKSEQFLANKATQYLTDKGEYPVSFDAIIAINENAAKPHAHPSNKLYKEGDLLLFDGGIKYKRYCSDRTVTFGNNLDQISSKQREQKFISKKHQKIYDIVRKAQETTIKKARSGMSAKQIDAIGRNIIEKAGYGKYFVHSTGHGVGLDIHEYPFISAKSGIEIEDNMVFTIEPGIYLPDEFGVRIEDTIVMEEGRAEIL